MIAQAQITIVDLFDPIQQGTAPANPVEDMLWLDTANDPPTLKRYDGTGWVECTIAQDDVKQMTQTIVKNSSDISSLSNEILMKVSTETFSQEMAGKADTDWITERQESIISQTNAQVEFQFNQAREYTIETNSPQLAFMEEVKSYQRFTSEGIELGASNSPFIAKLGNTKLSFVQDGTEIAYISNNRLYITEAQVTEKLSIGNDDHGYWDWITTSNGLALRWRG